MHGPAGGHLDAYEPVTGKKLWSYPSKYPLLASQLSTAGDLVFSGDPEGNFFALDARTGQKLWSFPTGSGHRGSSITYSVRGRQYVATPSGWGSALAGLLAAIVAGNRGFPARLDDVCLRPADGVALIVLALLFAQAAAEPARVARGEQIFAQSCSVGYCHGVAGAAGRGPRLRGRTFAKDYLFSVIRDGIPSSAMPAWKDRLKDDDIRAVVDYVASLATATDVAPPANPMPPGVGPASLPAFNGPPQAARGRALFSDPVRENCAICHAVGGRGIAVGPDLTAASALLNRIHSTESRQVLTASLQSGEHFPALLASQTDDEVRLYDLTSVPPVLRTFARSQVLSLARNSAWMHDDVTKNYSAAELEDIVAYLRWAATVR